MKRQIFCWIVSCLVLLTACQKEMSFEQGNKPGHGTLQEESTGDCLPKTVNGIYEATEPLVPASNFITIDVDVTETGTYVITTDTVNGIYFRATGVFTQTGMNTISLRGNGTPFTSGIHNFVVSYDGTACDIQVTTLPSGAGGPAVFTLETTGTSPVNCSGATAAGNYILNTPLNSSNTVTLSVNVTTIGTYTITSTLTNGMTFSKTDVFLATGVQNVTLIGSGTPSGTAGPVTVPVTVGSTTCNFQVTTQAGAEFTFDCSSAQINGTFTENVALSGASVDIDVNVTNGGPYAISVVVNGMTFAASGTFTTGPTSINLAATGTPAADGTFPVNMPGTTGCSFDVIVAPGAPPSDLKWKFTEGSVTYEGPTTGAIAASSGGISTVGISGTSTAPNADLGFQLNLTKTSGTMGPGTFNTNSTTNAVLFMIINTATSTTPYNGSFGNGLSFTVNITTYNTTTKIIEGTFSGQVKDASNANKTISNGTFKAELL